MNDLLRDLVMEEKVAVFIDDVMIAMEVKEGHDEMVEEVLKRLEENDLFVKPEKYIQKVREVRFLGVIIGKDKVRCYKTRKYEQTLVRYLQIVILLVYNKREKAHDMMS